MATITPTKITEAGVKQAFAATAVGGDEIVPLGNSTVVEFRNTHTASITITLTAQVTAYNLQGVGTVAKQNATLALAQDEEGCFVIENPGPYMNTNGRLAFTYASGNTLLKIRAVYH